MTRLHSSLWQQWLHPYTTLSLRGRSTRTQWCLYQITTLLLFWLPLLWAGLPTVATAAWTSRLTPRPGEEWLWQYLGAAFVLFSIVGLPLTVRRLHDMGCSGWWVLLPGGLSLLLLPFGAGLLHILAAHTIAIAISLPILGHARGDRETNDYGPNPRFYKKQIS